MVCNSNPCGDFFYSYISTLCALGNVLKVEGYSEFGAHSDGVSNGVDASTMAHGLTLDLVLLIVEGDREKMFQLS